MQHLVVIAENLRCDHPELSATSTSSRSTSGMSTRSRSTRSCRPVATSLSGRGCSGRSQSGASLTFKAAFSGHGAPGQAEVHDSQPGLSGCSTPHKGRQATAANVRSSVAWSEPRSCSSAHKTPVIGIAPHVCDNPITLCTETRSNCSVQITPACGRLLDSRRTGGPGHRKGMRRSPTMRALCCAKPGGKAG
jgi:hypothetical protein